MDNSCKVVQINLHHSNSASGILSKKLAKGEIDIALIQEPWVNNGKILGLGVKGYNTFYDATCVRPRACIVASSRFNVLNLVKYLDGDNVAIRVSYEIQGHRDEMIFLSAYLPYEGKNPLSVNSKALIEHCIEDKKKLIIGCDANAHHILWGSSDCNNRGEELLEDILYYNLCLLNKGNEPTFVTSNRKEVIDITLCNSCCYERIKDWKVSCEITLSDHRLITFSVTGPSKIKTEVRNPRKTNWGSYKRDLEEETKCLVGKFSSIVDLELTVDQLQRAILQSYYQNCPVTRTDSPRVVPWWSKELSILRNKCRKLFNRAKKCGDWGSYRVSLTDYNKAIRNAKRNSWRQFCDGINEVSTTAKVVKLMAKDRNCNLNTIKLSNGNFTESGRETLAEMLRVHFPGSNIVNGSLSPCTFPTICCGKSKWDIAKKVVTYDRVVWAIKSFGPFKTPGVDGIFPALLQEGVEFLAPMLCRIYRACIAYEHIPTAWRHTKVIFIPKVGKDNYYEAKSYRPISLTSFLLKTIEKLIDRHIRETVLNARPLSHSQHAYQPGKSVDTALYNLSFILESTLTHKEVALAVFLDIEGAFDKVPIETIIRALNKRGMDVTIVNWIKNLLSFRYINATLSGDDFTVHANAGCPQGGVLSPILWCLVVDSLLESINMNGLVCIGYADDVVIIARGKFINVVSSIISDGLKRIEKWCNTEGLSVNPQKTTMVAFTNKRNLKVENISFFDQILTCADYVKYLGVYFDSKLNWKMHFDYCLHKAKKVFWTCRSAIGRTWGLNPKVILWIYRMIICPIISYGSIVWWSRVRLDSAEKELNKLQRMICIAMSGCIRTTPTASLELLLGLHPLSMRIEAEAIICMKRFKYLGHWKVYSNYLSWKNFDCEVLGHPLLGMPSDVMLTGYAFDKPYQILLPSREVWNSVPTHGNKKCIIWFTDGSKMNKNTGSGVCCPVDGISFSCSLGNFATVFQAEVYAILLCCKICIDNDYKNKCIHICSDSQAALLALFKNTVTSHIVWECHNMLCQLAAFNKVYLYWVPGHSGISGNEMADDLARKGSASPFIGPEPVIGISGNLIRGTVYDIFRKKQCSNWRNIKGQRQAKELNQGCPSVRHKELMKLNRNGIRKVIGLLTGHCPLRRHLTVIGVKDDPICRGCSYDEETAEHILCDCEAYSAYRFEHLGRHLIEAWELQDIPVRSLLNFASATGLF